MVSDWTNDILSARALGIDAFALDLGLDPWQPDRIDDAYTAALAMQPPFKLFLSFDLSFNFTAQEINSYIQKYHGHLSQFTYRGDDFVSTFSGEMVTFGQDNANDGWQVEIKDVLAMDNITIYFVPEWSALDPLTIFQNNPVIDGFLSWNAW